MPRLPFRLFVFYRIKSGRIDRADHCGYAERALSACGRLLARSIGRVALLTAPPRGLSLRFPRAP